MKENTQIALGLVAAVAWVVTDGFLVELAPFLLLLVVCLTVVGLTWGRRLPLWIRVFTTGVVFYFGYSLCLVGRTMGHGFTSDTFESSLGCFLFFATLPTLGLFRLWQGRVRTAILLSALPVSLAFATLVAAYEEHRFIQRHSQGVGPTARWTVSNHWLAYDAETQRLSGSD